MDRNDAIKAIRAALKARSGITFSVKGGRGTAWGWIKIAPPPSATGEQRDKLLAMLAKLLSLSSAEYVSIPASTKHYCEYINRATGQPFEVAEAYWD